MSSLIGFKLILLSLVVMIALQLVARRLDLPPAAALLIGGIGMAFIPGLPAIELDPEFILIVFLPPLLMDGAYQSSWDEMRRNLVAILLLAIGAVLFTTVAVGLAVHWVVPSLPWGACFALGAIVSPPDAVAAKAVLERLSLPRRLMLLLEGESLLNDATGLVLVRFAVAAALTGLFSIGQATAEFAILAIGGAAVGIAFGYAVVKILRVLKDEYLIITATMLASWTSYLLGEAVGVSGVISTVLCGMTIGWFQHEVLSAAVRLRGTAFWRVVIFLLEALVFMLIGLSLRGVITRLGGAGDALMEIGPAVAAVLGAVVLSRFVWVFGTEALKGLRPGATRDWRAATVIGWAGMRGVVTLAIALSMPEDLPGRDLILVASFAVILGTVLVQGTTIGWLIRRIDLDRRSIRDARHISEPQAWSRLINAQFDAIEPLVRNADGEVIHPRLLEQFTYRKQMAGTLGNREDFPREQLAAHFDVVLAAVAAGRKELLRLHRSGAIHDKLMHEMERDLDLQEIAALHALG
jgi:CPA1 family monovalent cation:H+ antiporter